jgi:hypothetical protein
MVFAWILAAMPANIKQAQQLATDQYLRTRNYSSLQEQQTHGREEWLRSDFVRKANNFARLWARFAAQSNEKNSFDIDLARKLDKAFDDLRKLRAGQANNGDTLHWPMFMMPDTPT